MAYWWSKIRFGSFRDDTLIGTDANEKFIALSGDDLIDAGGGNDWIFAGSGNDTVSGGAGHDVVKAGRGNDVLLYDADRNDGGRDFYNGGPGYDTLVIDISQERLTNLGLTAQDIIDFFHDNNGNKRVDFKALGFDLHIRNVEAIEINVAPAAALFTPQADTVDFNAIAAGAFDPSTYFDAFDGNDLVILPDAGGWIHG